MGVTSGIPSGSEMVNRVNIVLALKVKPASGREGLRAVTSATPNTSELKVSGVQTCALPI